MVMKLEFLYIVFVLLVPLTRWSVKTKKVRNDCNEEKM